MAHDEDGEIARTLYSRFLMYLSLYSALFLGLLATSLGGTAYLVIARHATIPVAAVFIVVNILYSLFLVHSIHAWTAAGKRKSTFPVKRLSNLGSMLLLTGCLTISIVIIACGIFTNAIMSFGQGVFFTWIGLLASFGIGLFYLYDTKKRLSAMAGASEVPPFTLFQRMLIPVLSVVSILFVLLATGSYALNSKR